MSWPTWKDLDRRVRATYEDGSVAEGKLVLDDVLYPEPDDYGDIDDIPIFSVRSDDGLEREFSTNVKWEFV